jgi:hypothetical protein
MLMFQLGLGTVEVACTLLNRDTISLGPQSRTACWTRGNSYEVAQQRTGTAIPASPISMLRSRLRSQPGNGEFHRNPKAAVAVGPRDCGYQLWQPMASRVGYCTITLTAEIHRGRVRMALFEPCLRYEREHHDRPFQLHLSGAKFDATGARTTEVRE